MTRRAALILLIAVALRLACFCGPWTDDAHGYVGRAHDLSVGEFRPAWWNAADYRIGVLAPTAAMMALFGVNALSYSAVPFLASIAIVLLAYAAVRPFHGERAAVLAGLVAAVYPLNVQMAGCLMTDLPAAAMMGLSVLLWTRSRPWAAGFALGGAHLMRETAVYILLFLALHAIIRGHRTFLRTLLAYLVIVGIESAVYAVWLGDPLARWIPATAGMHHRLMVGHASDPAWLFDRLVVRIPSLLFNPGDYQWAFAGLTGVALLGSSWLWRRMRFFAAWAGTMLLMVNFWPNQLWPYAPGTYGWGRELSVIIIPASAMIGISAAAAWEKRTIRFLTGGLLTAHVCLNLLCAAYFREWKSALAGVEAAIEARPDAPVLADTISSWELEIRLKYRRQIRYFHPERCERGTLVVVNEMYQAFLEGVHPTVYDYPTPPPTWKIVYQRDQAAPLHGWRIQLVGGPEALKATSYRITVYEVP